MFLGHFGVALGSKKMVPEISLGLLFISALFLDLLWPTLLLLNLEKVEINSASGNITPLNFTHYPYSHSLVMVMLWSLLFGFICWLFTRNKRTGFILGLLVLSHWVLDLVVHIPDLPIYPGDSPLLGFGLWKSLVTTIVIEGFIFIVGIILYLRATRAKNKIGSIGFWIFIVFLTGIYIINLSSPPPPSVNTIAWAGQLQWILVLFAFWVDRNRKSLPE